MKRGASCAADGKTGASPAADNSPATKTTAIKGLSLMILLIALAGLVALALPAGTIERRPARLSDAADAAGLADIAIASRTGPAFAAVYGEGMLEVA